MATDQLMAPIPSLILAPGMQIRWEAVHPTTGAAVAGVTVKNISIVGVAAGVPGVQDGGLRAGPFMLVPGPGELAS